MSPYGSKLDVEFVAFKLLTFPTIKSCIFILQVIKMVEDEGAKYLKTNYSREPTALISQGLNYVQVEVSTHKSHSLLFVINQLPLCHLRQHADRIGCLWFFLPVNQG